MAQWCRVWGLWVVLRSGSCVCSGRAPGFSGQPFTWRRELIKNSALPPASLLMLLAARPAAGVERISAPRPRNHDKRAGAFVVGPASLKCGCIGCVWSHLGRGAGAGHDMGMGSFPAPFVLLLVGSALLRATSPNAEADDLSQSHLTASDCIMGSRRGLGPKTPHQDLCADESTNQLIDLKTDPMHPTQTHAQHMQTGH